MADSKFNFIDEDKELSGEANVSADETPSGEVSEADNSTQSKETSQPSIEVGGESFASVESLKEAYEAKVRSYDEFRSLSDKQTNELGELRKAIDEMKDSHPKPVVNNPEFDIYDPSTHDEYFNSRIDQQVQQRLSEERAKQTQAKIEDAQKEQVRSFSSNHPEMSREQLLNVARFGDERGITFIEDAYEVYLAKDKRDKAPEKKETSQKLEDVAQVPPTLSSAGSSGSQTGVNYDEVPFEQWVKIPEDERKKALMESPAGY